MRPGAWARAESSKHEGCVSEGAEDGDSMATPEAKIKTAERTGPQLSDLAPGDHFAGPGR